MSAGLAATAAEFGGQIIPGDARLEDEEDTGEDHAIIERLATWEAKSTRRMRRQQRLKAYPKRVRYKRLHDEPSWGSEKPGQSRLFRTTILTMNYQLISCQMTHFFRML